MQKHKENLKEFVKKSQALAVVYCPMYVSHAAYTNFLVTVRLVENQIKDVEVAVSGATFDVNKIYEKIIRIGSTMRCAAAKVFLLDIEADEFSADNNDWRDELHCLEYYKHGAVDVDAKFAYGEAVLSDNLRKASKLLHEMFEQARKVELISYFVIDFEFILSNYFIEYL